jgi:hypothetical protein
MSDGVIKIEYVLYCYKNDNLSVLFIIFHFVTIYNYYASMFSKPWVLSTSPTFLMSQREINRISTCSALAKLKPPSRSTNTQLMLHPLWQHVGWSWAYKIQSKTCILKDYHTKNILFAYVINNLTFYLWRCGETYSLIYCMEMRRNLFVDLLAHERNGYQRFLPADIKHYLSHITERSIK